MDRLDDGTLLQLTEAHMKLAALKSEAQRLVDEVNAKLAALSDQINDVREQALVLIEPAARKAELSYDAQPWLWQDDSAGQSFREWRDGLSGARDVLATEVRLHLKPALGFVILDDVFEIFEGGFTASPGA